MPQEVLKAIITADTSSFNRNIESASGSIEELRQVSKGLKTEISGLDASLRNSKGGKVLQAELRSVNTELKSLEKQAGISGAATGNALTKGFSGIRTLANILPGIGIAGIFGLAFEGVEKLIDGLIRLGGSFDPVKELAATIAGAEKKFVEASTAVATLKEEIDLAKQGFIDKDKVVKQYNDTIGKTTGFVKTLDEAEAALNRNAEAYIRFTLLKAAANIALEKAAQKAFDAEQARQKAVQEFNTIGSRASSFSQGQSSAPGLVPVDLSGGFIARQKAAEDAKAKIIKTAEDEKNGLVNIGNDLLKQAAEISKQFGFNFFGNNELKKGAAQANTVINDTISEAKRLADFLNDTTIRGFRFEVDPRDSLQATFERAKEFIQKTEGPRSAFAIKINAFAQIDTDDPQLFKNLPKETEDLAKKTEKLIQDLASRNQIAIKFELGQLELRNAQRRLDALAATLTASIQQSIGGALEGVGEAIGKTLAGQDFGTQLFSVLGDLITQIGKALIQFGIAQAVALKVIKNPFGSPGVAIAAGILAVAAGTLIKNIKGQRAVGGQVNAGDAYLVGERGQEVFRPNVSGNIIPNNAIAGARGTQLPMQITGMFRVQGNDLVAAIANTNRSQGRLN